ncbi:DUF6044 family protein [Rhodonellum sp.]|uniref:DUF6044 family protein n=1 Tax=Rhodonellum sp. TaxID=2231180 RepID=UPI0027286EB6|nr:DUF6044 family protein [Rhodonellum sp.]MDO9551787.1 DUF6044 family protein [Rhodonellum sp.]
MIERGNNPLSCLGEISIAGWSLVTVVLWLLMFPYLWLGEQVPIIVSDNLDSNVAWYKMLRDQGMIFSGPMEMVKGMVIETPRMSYPSGLNLELLLYFFFPPFLAYALNKFLIGLIAFACMFVFLSHQKPENSTSLTKVLFSLVWATLVFYPHRGISIAALPLIFVLVDQLRFQKLSALHFGIIFVYAGYSMFALAGFFIWVTFSIWSIFWMWRDRKWHVPHIFLLGFWLFCSLVQEYQLLYALFGNHGFESHRKELTFSWGLWTDWTLWGMLKSGDYSGIFHSVVYPLLAGVLLISTAVQKKLKETSLLLLVSLLGILLCCWGISNLGFLDQMGTVISKLNSINLLRFNHLLPFLLFALLGILILQMDFRFKNHLLILLIGLNIFVYQYEWRHWLSRVVPWTEQQVPSFQSYFAVTQFEEIKTYLGEGWKHAVIGHLNFPPAVSAYNGLTCLDGYLQNYDLTHKHAVGKAIAQELNKNEFLSDQFYLWGNKCYLQNATYPDDFTAFKWRVHQPIQDLDFDFTTLKNDLKVDYLLSSVLVEVPELVLLHYFQNELSAWDLYLYQIK